MKAWVLHEIGDIRWEEVEQPVPGEQEVLLRVRAAGICGSDVPRIYTSGTYSYPLIPGHEFAGEVVACGEGVSEEWLGQRTGVFPLIPCRECGPCRQGYYELCRPYSYLGSRRAGGFAEYVAVPVWNLLRLPEQAAFEEAAMLEPMSVAVHAMRRVHPAAGDVAVISGLGTIGLLLLMFLKEAGIEKLLVLGKKDFQRQQALRMGIPEEDYYDVRQGGEREWLQEKTGHCGADVFFECVGSNRSVELAVDSTAPAGRVMLVGNPYSDMTLPKAVYWKILRNQLTVTGSWNSSYTGADTDDWHYVMQRLAERRIAPAELISHRFSMEELERGFHIMRDKSEDYVKVMGIL